MRALLGVLRVEDDVAADLEPAHGLADLPALADRVTAAGIKVTLDVRGEPRDLLPGLDLAAYRVTQEALTNVVKHSGAATSGHRPRQGGSGRPGDHRRRPRDKRPRRRARDQGDAGTRGALRRDVPGRSGAGRQLHRHRAVPGMIRVLVADDQALLRGSLRLLVDSAPDLTAVGEAGTGAEALALAVSEQPNMI